MPLETGSVLPLDAFEPGAPRTGMAARGVGPARLTSSPAPFAAVTVLTDLADAAPFWTALEAIAPASPYQQLAWVAAWLDTEGRATAVVPTVVVALDVGGRPVALLPLGVQRRGFLRRATFLGGRQTNYNIGLFDPDVPWIPDHGVELLHEAARIIPGGVDLFALTNQPERWASFANPLAGLPQAQPSPSPSHKARLQPDGEAFLKHHLSGANRKKLRAKRGYLEALGPVRIWMAATPEEAEAVVSAHVAQKVAKLATLGIRPPDTEELTRLLLRAAEPQGDAPPLLELHALSCGERIVATFGGLAHRGRFSGLMISYALDPAFARCSPGELLLSSVIAQKCQQNFEEFDLGIGEARYKDSYCPFTDPLVDVVVPISVLGRAAGATETAKLRLKAAIKQSPRAWRLAQTVRRRLGQWR